MGSNTVVTFDTDKLPCYAIISVSADHELCAPFLHRQEPTALFYEKDMAAIRMLSNTKRFIVPVQFSPRDEFTLVSYAR